MRLVAYYLFQSTNQMPSICNNSHTFVSTDQSDVFMSIVASTDQNKWQLNRSIAKISLCEEAAKMKILLLIHEADPQSRPVVVIVFAHVVRSYVRPSPIFKTKQISNENNVHYWRDCGSGRVDH